MEKDRTENLNTDNKVDEKTADMLMNYIDVVNRQLREPATNIFALLPMLAESINTQDTEKAQETLQQVYRRTYNLLRNVNNMTIASKMLGANIFEKEAVDLSSLVRSVFESSKIVMPAYYKLALEIEDNLFVSASKTVLTTGLFNLILNSFDYRGENDVKIVVFVKKQDGNAVITFRDNSIGMNPQLSQQAMQPYFSCNPYDDGESNDKLGLGLYILEQAVKQAGGTVFMKTQFGKGVSVAISIPLTDTEASDNLKSSNKDYIFNKYSELYLQLCDYCNLPDLS